MPIKPKLSAFEEVPFTTDAAEYDVLQSPNSSTKIDVGYLPTEDAPAKPANAAVGANPLASKGYTLAPLFTWGFDFYVMNPGDRRQRPGPPAAVHPAGPPRAPIRPSAGRESRRARP